MSFATHWRISALSSISGAPEPLTSAFRLPCAEMTAVSSSETTLAIRTQSETSTLPEQSASPRRSDSPGCGVWGTVVSHQELSDEESAELLGTKSIHAAQKAADASADGSFDIDDPQGILLYYTMGITGQAVSWDDIFGE